MRLSVIILMLAVLSMSLAARAADLQPPTVSTTGEATVYVVPDKVIVNFGVQTTNKNLDEAKSANETAAASLVKAIKALGVAEQDIATDHLDVRITYEDRSNMLQISGYVVRRDYAISLKDVKLFDKLVDAALKNGANQVGGVSFQTTDLRKYRDQARQMAIKAAKEKAVALAKELECTVGKPHTISESGGYVTFGGAQMYGNAWAGQNSVQVVAGGGDGSETLPLGQIGVQASVSVTFDLNN